MAEEAEPDTASWVEVEVTLYFTAVTTAAFLLIFEIGRRSPTMKSAVFDRRRQHAPVKTPPPLMNGLGEWLFVSTDPEYWEYADMVHWKKVIQERKRQQQDLEQRNARRHRAQQQGGGGGRLLRGPLELVGSRSSGGGRDSHDDEYDVENGNAPPNSSSNNSNKKQYLRLLSNGSSNNNSTSNRAIEPTHYLTPDVFELDGRRLPIAIAEYAISNDLTEEQLDQYQYQLYQREQLEEQKYKQAVEQEHIGQNVPSKLQYIGVRQRNSIYLTFWKRFCGCCFHRKNNTNDNEDPNNNNTLNNDPRSVRSFLTTSSDDRISRVSSGRSILASNRRRGSATSNALHDTSTAPVNRHLKTQTAANKRPLGIADEELLRCVGLDTYVMIRFLRWAYDCTFYPFLLACITIIPVYYTNPYEGDSEEGIITGGYFRFTINRLEAESVRLWVPWAYAIVFYCYCLRRVWVEWETFIALRFDFLANGDVGQNQQQQQDILRQQKRKQKQQQIQHGQHRPQNDVELHLEQYRNSCLVEYIPDSHNRDRELFEFFSAIFPNQVKRAEILLNATRLTRLIQERQNYIESYENLYAIHFREKQMYRGRNNGDNDDDEGQGGSNGSGRRRSKHGKPQEPKIALTNIKRPRCWPCQGQKLVKAFPYYLSEIKRLNIEIEEEHERIMVEKQKSEDTQESQNLFSMGLELGSRFVTGESTELTCTTGFVEFTNLTAKQNAIQCNLTGETNFMRTTSAPDPRDLIWENATVEASLIQWKRLQCDSLLLTGALFWSVVVTFITSISNLDRLDDFLPSWLIPKEDTFWYGLIQGYLPVIFLEFFMMFVPPILRAIAQNFIRFKTRSEVDKFVFLWHFVYRLANLLIIIVSGSIYDTLTEGISSPSAVISKIAGNIAQSSQFFLNNMIVAAGTENFFELSQSLQIIIHLGVQQVIQMEAKSNRQMEKLKAAAQFEWGWVMPPFIFAFLVGAVYCTMVPVVLGACAIFFYIATKVYIHQALYVYAQPYEGGGKLMYMLNRTVFTILYIAIIIFSTVLGLRQAPLQGPSFFFIMMIITLYMDRRVQTKFVKPSLTLALTNSRFIDEDNKKKAERAQRYQEYKAAKEEKRLDELRKSGKGGKAAMVASSLKQRGKRESKSKDGDDFYLYRQPMLNKLLWETKPRILADEAGKFALRLIPGLFPYYLFKVLTKYLQSQNKLAPSVWIGILANGMNAFFNWVLIYALDWGIRGAPWATTLTRLVEFILIVIYIYSQKLSTSSSSRTPALSSSVEDSGRSMIQATWPRLSKENLQYSVLKPFWKIAISGALSISAEAWSFEITTILAGLLGTTALDAHIITFSIATFIYLSFPFAVGIASSIRVGQLIGDRQPMDAKRSCYTSLGLSAGMQAILVIILLPCKDIIGDGFSNDQDVAKLVSELIPISCIFMMGDAVQATIGGALRGLGRQRLVLWLNILGFWIFAVPIGSILTFQFDLGVHGLWWGMVVGIYGACLIGIGILRFHVDWQSEAKKAIKRINTTISSSTPQTEQ